MPAYKLVAHPDAAAALDSESAPEQLREVLRDVAGRRDPCAHPKVSPMRDGGLPRGMCRVRVGDWRAVCRLAQPELRVVAVGHREQVYDVAHARVGGGGR